MSYVSIWKPVNDRIVQASLDTKTEIIGLLLGRLEDDTIIIEDSITGEFLTEPNRATLPSTTLAKIADNLVSGRIKGNIVGWYHSHTQDGLFFSEPDIQTQKKLQQFSSLVTGMVVDVVTGDAGYFRVDTQTGKAVRIPDEKVRVYQDASEAIPSEIRNRSRIRPTPTIEVRARPNQPKQPTQRLIISVILIALAASAAFLAVLFYRGTMAGPTLSISHNPILGGAIGTPVEVKANVTGTVRNVTLIYDSSGGTSFRQGEMSSAALNEYRYMIPGEQVTGSLSYYIKAADKSGYSIRTALYLVQVSDFTFLTKNLPLTVYRTKSAVAQLDFLFINGFNQQLSLSAKGAPQGLAVTFSPNPIPRGTTTVDVKIATDSNTPNGTYPVVVAATYTPPEGPTVSRQSTVLVAVADFDLQVSPTSREVSGGTDTSYSLTLTIQRAFVDPVLMTIQGLPQGATYQLVASGSTIQIGGPGRNIMTLQITTTLATKSGTYNLTISATGGGIVHSQNVKLIVR